MKAIPATIISGFRGVEEGYGVRVHQYHVNGFLPQLRYTFQEMRKLENKGFCVFCGKTQSYVEPDAEMYACNHCHMPGVYGFEQLMLKGMTR